VIEHLNRKDDSFALIAGKFTDFDGGMCAAGVMLAAVGIPVSSFERIGRSRRGQLTQGPVSYLTPGLFSVVRLSPPVGDAGDSLAQLATIGGLRRQRGRDLLTEVGRRLLIALRSPLRGNVG